MDAQELMDTIVSMDVRPPIFQVFVKASGYAAGYTAFVDFRSVGGNVPSSLECHAETVVDALTKLMNTLSVNFGKCPHCGGYKNTANKTG